MGQADLSQWSVPSLHQEEGTIGQIQGPQNQLAPRSTRLSPTRMVTF